jgi:FtsP/CotA-like multicopper oxidase with cupredoxin domain/peroxiredoxin
MRRIWILSIFLICFDCYRGASVLVGQVVDLRAREEIVKANQELSRRWNEHRSGREDQESSSRRRSLLYQSELNPAEKLRLEALLPMPQRRSRAQNSEARFVEPETLRSENGVLRVTLEVRYGEHRIGDDPVKLRGFNGQLVGPTLRVNPGDKLCITLKNSLAGERWQPHMMNTIHSFNTTNLHFHGLHVSPNGISDNVLIQVGPSETQEYVVEIPKDHTTGTYWYHPHLHGSTSGNVASGMSGALIVEAAQGAQGLDNVPEIKAAKERVMVLNQIPYINKDSADQFGPPKPDFFGLDVGVVEAQYAAYMFGPGAWDKLGRYTTINGVQLPVIRMQPGQVERWRIIDSGQRESIKLKLIDADATNKRPRVPFHEVAVDGLALGAIIESDSIELWPGYRSDVLIQAPNTPGEYILIDDEEQANGTMSGSYKPQQFVARLSIQGDPLSMALPKASELVGLRLPSIKDDELTGKQQATYGILKQGGNITFTIDGKSFDMENARELKLNDIDEWTLRSINDVGPVTHPFHIHVNPFEVTSILAPVPDENGNTMLVEQLKNGPVWRDTVKIPGDGKVTMRTRYTDFIGTFVQHCHILDHEDQGMMQLIDIFDPKDPPNAFGSSTLPPGSIAPDFQLADSSGKNYSLADFKGKPTIIFFFKGHGCLHCVQQVSVFTDHYLSFKSSGIEVIGITSDTQESLSEALQSNPCPFPLLADPKGIAFEKFRCTAPNGLQHGTFMLSEKQKIIWRTVGSSPFLAVEDLIPLKSLEISGVSGAGSPIVQASELSSER